MTRDPDADRRPHRRVGWGYGARPRVVAHRGGSAGGGAAEHTLRAYERALEHGADGLECDVRLTRDGALVCIHDRRVDRVSDGTGAVSALELAALRELDFAARADRPLPDPLGEEPDRDGSGVLTLDRLLALVADCGRRVELAVETKHPNRYGGFVELRLTDLLRRHGLPRRTARGSDVRVMSFSATALRRVRRLAPGLPTVHLVERLTPGLVTGRVAGGADVAGPGIELLRRNPGYVRRAQARGHEVHVWTVNEPADVRLCVELGVDVVITDHPRRVLELLATLGPAHPGG